MADMQSIGNDLYAIVSLCHPELAPKLTGMLLQLGEAECLACLEDQEKLAERLDEAMAILDESGQSPKKTVTSKPGERRIDPEDGQERTLEELRKLCHGTYSSAEVEEYWATMRPVSVSPVSVVAAAEAAAKKVAKPAAVSSVARAVPPKADVVKAADVVEPAATPAAAEGPASKETVPGLHMWLTELKLSRYVEAAASWCDEMGACTLEEVLENLDDFAADVGMKPLEQKRLQRDGAAAMEVAEAAVKTCHAAPQTRGSDKAMDRPIQNAVASAGAAQRKVIEEDHEESDEEFDADESARRDQDCLAREIMGVQLDDYEAGTMDEYADFQEPPQEDCAPVQSGGDRPPAEPEEARSWRAPPAAQDGKGDKGGLGKGGGKRGMSHEEYLKQRPTASRTSPAQPGQAGRTFAARSGPGGSSGPAPTADDFPTLGGAAPGKKGKRKP